MRAAYERADQEEFARARAMTQDQRIAALQAASLTAQRVLEAMSPEAIRSPNLPYALSAACAPQHASMRSVDALSLAVELGQLLETAGIPYAIGGAPALGVHGVSRSTQDVVNVFVKEGQLETLLTLLRENDVTVDADHARTVGVEEGVFFSWAGATRIDVFLPSIDLSWEALRTRVSVTVQGQPTRFLSPELLCCFKLLFFRPKDLLDLERLVKSSTSLDRGRVRALIVEAMGEDDERVRAWDAMATG